MFFAKLNILLKLVGARILFTNVFYYLQTKIFSVQFPLEQIIKSEMRL